MLEDARTPVARTGWGFALAGAGTMLAASLSKKPRPVRVVRRNAIVRARTVAPSNELDFEGSLVGAVLRVVAALSAARRSRLLSSARSIAPVWRS